MTTHELKCLPMFYDAVVAGTKEFEVRRNDRDFQSGDAVILKEYEPQTDQYSGRQARATVGYLLPFYDIPGLHPAAADHVVFALVDMTAIIP